MSSGQETFRRSAIWLLVYLIPAHQAMLPIEDPDIWWHLRTGQWILEHGFVPQHDPFSRFGAGRPWLAYSWLFEVWVYGLHRHFGLSGLVAFTVSMSLAIALTIHLLLRRARLPFLAEASCLALVLAALKPVLSPRPWLFSILLAGIQLILIADLRRSRKFARGLLLIPLFAVWANLHIQFVYGLAVMGLLLAEAVCSGLARQAGRQVNDDPLPLAHAAALFVLCVLAACINPYFHRIYLPVLEYATQTGAFQSIEELHPMFFRSLRDWIVLLLTVAAAFALGWQRRWNIFHIGLLALAACLAFRARRDGWVLALAAAAIVGDISKVRPSGDPYAFNRHNSAALVAGMLASLYVLSHHLELNEGSLARAVEARFPVRAAEFVRSHNLQGELYNSLDWGGYLIWSLPHLPVAMDGRTNLHGDERIARSLATWSGALEWDKDPELVRAGVIVAERSKPLTRLLRRHPGYELVYEDATAAVLVAREASP